MSCDSSSASGQDEIWSYFQNEGAQAFSGSGARQRSLAGFVGAGEDVLNVGVGVGIFEQLALSRGARVCCVDPDPRAIASIRDRFSLGDRARVGYGQHIPFSAASFDSVVLSEVLEHLSDDVLAETLDEVMRVLRPGGRLIGTVPREEELREQIVVCPHCARRFHRWGHQQSFTEASVRSILAEHFNVQLVRSRLYTDWAALNWKGRVTAFLKRGLLAFGIHGQGENIFFLARRR